MLKKLTRRVSHFFYDDVNGLQVPYLVYIPSGYDEKTPQNMVLYLHGGVANTIEFNDKKYYTQKEPIFKIAEELNFIVLYPFGKKTFGWVYQPESFVSVYKCNEQS